MEKKMEDTTFTSLFFAYFSVFFFALLFFTLLFLLFSVISDHRRQLPTCLPLLLASTVDKVLIVNNFGILH